MKVRLFAIVFAVVVLVALSAVPVSAAEQLANCTGTDVIKCPVGYGHLVVHGNLKVWDEGDCVIKFDFQAQCQLLLKLDTGNEVWKDNFKIVCNGRLEMTAS